MRRNPWRGGALPKSNPTGGQSPRWRASDNCLERVDPPGRRG
jgi:hypothetical protein